MKASPYMNISWHRLMPHERTLSYEEAFDSFLSPGTRSTQKEHMFASLIFAFLNEYKHDKLRGFIIFKVHLFRSTHRLHYVRQ